MTPNEQKAYEWEKEFEEKFGGTKTYLYFAKKPNDIKSFIASQIAQARADERRRIGELIENMDYDNYVETKKWYGSDGEEGYETAKEELLSLINKE